MTNADAATAAAQTIIGDLTAKRCAAVPQVGTCNRLTLDPPAAGADFDHGIAVFNVTASAGDNFALVLGRDQADAGRSTCGERASTTPRICRLA